MIPYPKSKFLLALILCLLAAPLSLSAQSTSGSMSGSIQDKNGAAISNARVVVTDQSRQVSFTTTTDGEGRFAFAQLQPARYNVKVESAGFRKFELKDVVLNANDKLSVGALTMEVGAVEQIVEVVSEGQQLKTESAERSDALVGEQLQNVAVNSRTYLALAAVTPGVIVTGNFQTAGHAGLSTISANGARFNQNQLTLNGVGNVDTGNNGDQLATVSLDSVQEFKILTSNYQAEYGRSAGAQINVVTKSGSREFHGSGYLFHRHEGLNANNWKNNRDGLQRNLYRFNDVGYTIGGPVKIPKVLPEDKLFFFWSQEYQRQLRPQGRRDVTLPTALERQGDFSQSVDRNGAKVFIKDPLKSGACNATVQTACFTDSSRATASNPTGLNIIPQARLYAPGVAILNIFPTPNAQSASNRGFNFTTQNPDSYPRREDMLRMDANLSNNWKMFGHFLNNYDSVTSDYGSFVLGSNTPFGTPITDTRPGRSIAVGVTTIISPTTTNEFTWGYSHNQINIDPVNDGLTRSKNGLTNLPVLFPSAIQNDFIPRFQFNGTRINNEPTFGTNNAPFFNYNTTIDWIDNFSKVWNQHLFKAGVYIQRSRKDQTSFANSSGQFNFGDSSGNPNDTGFGFANAAVGVFTSFNQASQYATGKYRYTNLEFYLQDTWKVTRRLTLDYGMRFYYIQPQYDSALQTATFLPERFDPSKAVRLYRPALDGATRIAFDPVTGEKRPGTDIGKIVPNSGNMFNGIAQAGKDVSKYLMENRGFQYGPRLGLAFDLTGDQNIVLRAGGGVFYDRFQGNETFDMLTNPPTTLAPTLVNGFIKDINPNSVLFAPFGLNAFSFEGKIPTVYNYSLGVQAKLPYELLLDVAYVGSVSRHLLQRLNINPIQYGATFLPQNQDPTKTGSAPLGSNALDADFLRRYQGYGSITLHQMGGTSNYNSLQVGLNRRFARGLFFGLAYTWSKALATVTNDGDFIRIDSNTRLANYGPAGFDRRHNFSINYIYELPNIARRFGADNKFTRAAFDGWQISGITRFQSGSPFGVGFNIPNIGNQNITGSNTEGGRVKLIGNPLDGTSDDPYRRLNPAAFAAPAVGSIGLDAPVNYLTTPGINNWDLTLQKEFSIKEAVRLQLRADAFNVFNHTQFSGINSTINFTSLTNSTPTNLPFNADGSLRDRNGFGTVSAARDPRIMQLVVRLQF
jgi:hypothetical protein